MELCLASRLSDPMRLNALQCKKKIGVAIMDDNEREEGEIDETSLKKLQASEVSALKDTSQLAFEVILMSSGPLNKKHFLAGVSLCIC